MHEAAKNSHKFYKLIEGNLQHKDSNLEVPQIQLRRLCCVVQGYDAEFQGRERDAKTVP